MNHLVKKPEDIEKMREGGEILRKIKNVLFDEIKPGKNAYEIELLTQKLIKENNAEPSFMTVKNYKWATCINVNDGIVHGIPKKEIVFKKDDLVSVDLGVLYKNMHTDSSFTKYLGDNPKKQKFLAAGKEALKNAIKVTKAGNKVGDISEQIEKTIKKYGFSPTRQLTGHSVGYSLHEDPLIPCVATNSRDEKVEIKEGMTLAIEVMYALGSDELFIDNDGWTIRTQDGTITALFEETILVTQNEPIILT